MQIVIDIPEEEYEEIIYSEDCGLHRLTRAIAKGTVLPKGHGRLIDADELKSLSYEVLVEDGNSNRADGLSSYNGLTEEDIELAPTIIEADKESEEE